MIDQFPLEIGADPGTVAAKPNDLVCGQQTSCLEKMALRGGPPTRSVAAVGSRQRRRETSALIGILLHNYRKIGL
jgi:hypothetical protein